MAVCCFGYAYSTLWKTGMKGQRVKSGEVFRLKYRCIDVAVLKCFLVGMAAKYGGR